MPEYIKREAVLEWFEPYTHEDILLEPVDVISEIRGIPAADVVEVVHGRWITHNKGQNNWCECSECNTVGSPFWKRCPMCEAKMDGDENENH